MEPKHGGLADEFPFQVNFPRFILDLASHGSSNQDQPFCLVDWTSRVFDNAWFLYFSVSCDVLLGANSEFS